MASIRRFFKLRPTIVWLGVVVWGLFFLYASSGLRYAISGLIIEKLYYPFYKIGLSLEEYRDAREENLSLKRDIIELSFALERLREAEAENKRLKSLLEIKENSEFKFIVGRVIDRNRSSTLIIDRGSKDGVSKNMPALDTKGVVGKVVDVSENTAVVELLTNPNFRISAIDTRSRVLGIVRMGEGNELEMIDVPVASDVAVGDEIVSSGLGGIFPKGLKIGEVIWAFDPKEKMFKEIRIRPFAEINKIEELFIIQGTASIKAK
jgi:rod shape-determining protein MreC